MAVLNQHVQCTVYRRLTDWQALVPHCKIPPESFGTLASQSECDAGVTPVIVTRVHLQFEKQMYKV